MTLITTFSIENEVEKSKSTFYGYGLQYLRDIISLLFNLIFPIYGIEPHNIIFKQEY